MKGKKKLIYICATVAALVCGCEKKSTPFTNASRPGKTSVPITGAWGWTLGAKLPGQATIMDHYFWAPLSTNDAPFLNVYCICLEDRTICEVGASADFIENQLPVEDALKSKYGDFGITIDGDISTRHWTNGDCEIHLEEVGIRSLKLVYRNAAFYRQYGDELDSDSHRAGTKLAPKL